MSISQIMHPEEGSLVTECRRLGWMMSTASRGDPTTSLNGPSVQTGSESDASFHPEVWPVEHLLPEGNLLPGPVHPRNRPTKVPTGPKVEPGSAEEILSLPDPVVVPNCKLKAALHHLFHAETRAYWQLKAMMMVGNWLTSLSPNCAGSHSRP